MLTKENVFQSGDTERIWKRFCGYLDLTTQEFMGVQRRLLEEQLEVMPQNPLWKKIMNGKTPKTLEEFREIAPLTAYWTHYGQYIGNKEAKWLVSEPGAWIRTSGRGGNFKWIPWTVDALEKYADAVMASVILACADRKGEVRVQQHARVLALMAPSPYISGITGHIEAERFDFRIMPPPDISETLEFQERIQMGFKMAMQEGVDFVGAVSTALVKLGEGMATRSQGLRMSSFMLRPSVLMRVLRAYVNSKRLHRAMLPKDLWPIKGMTCGGTDASIYRDKLKLYWGKVPHEWYGMTECGAVAMQSWTKKGMTFYPYLAFLEFIPEQDWLKSRQQSDYTPRTVLMDELEVGKIYEVVITSLHGMPLVRYRPGDLVRVTALEEKESGVKLPQVEFYSRADFLIDLYSIVRLDEKTVWQAIDAAGIPYEDWSARKEYEGGQPVLRVYFEPKQSITDIQKAQQAIHEKLREFSPFYDEAIHEMETNPVRIVPLAVGSFQNYYEIKRSQGADLAHLKPPHMNATDVVMNELLALGKKSAKTGA